MTQLSVNLNKVALLRNARGGHQPDLAHAAQICIEAGCDGLTVHPRPDLRHTRPEDVVMLSRMARSADVEFNIEGNPFAPPRGDYPGLLALCQQAQPDQVTLVPDSDSQLTSDHGFDPHQDINSLAAVIPQLTTCCGRVSLFVDTGVDDLSAFAQVGADRVELYTGPFAAQFSAGDATREILACRSTFMAAESVGMQVNAGHDLDQHNLPFLLENLPGLAEVSIGHALICDALYAGLHPTVAAYKSIVGSD